MKNRKVLYKMLVLALPVLGLSFAQADTSKVFKPSPEPVFSTPRAKPNIHMVLDDSGSMGATDVPSIVDGHKITRKEALKRTVKSLMQKYRDKAYLGITFIYQYNSASGLIALKLDDYSLVSDAVFNQHIKNISDLIQSSPGNTPIYTAVYDTLKMFRGQPVSAAGNRTSTQQIEWGTGWNKERTNIYQYKQLPSPIRYRCQQNHMIVMTDGEANTESVTGVATIDSKIFDDANSRATTSLADRKNRDGIDIIGGVHQKEKINLTSLGPQLGHIIATTDLKKWVGSEKDDAGKYWDDTKNLDNSTKYVPMPLNVHSVSLYVDPKDKLYKNLTHALSPIKEMPGMNLGFGKNASGTAEDLLLAFDTIFASIVLSTSSTSAMNDRFYADMLDKAPIVDQNGNIDMSTVGTVRYDTVYDFRPRFGSIRANVSYIDTLTDEIRNYELWNTDKSITSNQGRYVTLLQQDGKKTGLHLSQLTDKLVLDHFKKIDPKFSHDYINWLVDFTKIDSSGDLRGRLNPLGSITNSDIVTANKDILNISVDKNKMSVPLRKDLLRWLLYKANHQPKNLLIVGDNDGFINFINAQRGLTGNHKGGQRDTAYFPQILVHRFDEIAKSNRIATLVMEGKTGLVDAKVHQTFDNGISGEALFATVGLTSMGAGGKGLVGYRIYAEQASVVDSWATGTVSQIDPDSVYKKVTPLFEITNEGPHKTPGFKDLGYTYSGFEFFNRIENDGKGQAVAIFGNGFGTNKSVLYFIDAYTGEKLHEIVLDPKGMGAATPSIVTSQDEINGGQKLDRIYVGDYSGTMYVINFNGSNDFKHTDATVTALFKTPATPNNFGQSAISVKPLVVRGKNSNVFRVFFGSGVAASHELDRYKNSLVTHGIYGITDTPGSFASGSKKLASDSNASLVPIFTVENLKKGFVRYNDSKKVDYDKLDLYDLTIHTPTSDEIGTSNNMNRNGWYIVLSADNGSKNVFNSHVGGIGSGERVIRNPQYDSKNNAVIFSTWGIDERTKGYNEDVKNDPCVADLVFGKVLSFYAETGGGSYDIKGIGNTATTGKAEGGLTGSYINNAPEGNNITSIDDLSDEIVQDLIDAVGNENSSYEKDDNNASVYVVGGTDGSFRQSGSGGDGGIPIGKRPIRLSIQTLFNN